MAQHHAFGAPGRAAGVEDAGKLVVSCFSIRNRRGGREQAFVIRQRLRAGGLTVVGVNDRQRADPLGDFAAHCRERGVDEHDLRAAVAKRILIFQRAPPYVQGYDDGPGPGDAKKELDIPVLVQTQNGDAVAAGDPQSLQRAGEPGDAVGQFGERSPPILEHDRGSAAIQQ